MRLGDDDGLMDFSPVHTTKHFKYLECEESYQMY